MDETALIYCPHCGANSRAHAFQCQEEYNGIEIITCYACGQDHIRDVNRDLRGLLRDNPLRKYKDTDCFAMYYDDKQSACCKCGAKIQCKSWCMEAKDPRASTVVQEAIEAIKTDHTGLAQTIAEMQRVIKGYDWIPARQWGSYDCTQQTVTTLQDEVSNCFEELDEIATKGLKSSGNRAQDWVNEMRRRIINAKHPVFTSKELTHIYDRSADCDICKSIVKKCNPFILDIDDDDCGNKEPLYRYTRGIKE